MRITNITSTIQKSSHNANNRQNNVLFSGGAKCLTGLGKRLGQEVGQIIGRESDGTIIMTQLSPSGRIISVIKYPPSSDVSTSYCPCGGRLIEAEQLPFN